VWSWSVVGGLDLAKMVPLTSLDRPVSIEVASPTRISFYFVRVSGGGAATAALRLIYAAWAHPDRRFGGGQPKPSPSSAQFH